jgi:hypothetical protein
LRVEKPLLHYLYVIEWDLPEEETNIPHLEPKYSGLVEELTRRFVGIRPLPPRREELRTELGNLRKSMELLASDPGIDKLELALFLYDRSRGGLVCVATTDTEINGQAFDRLLFKPGRGIPGRAYRTMEVVAYANLPQLKCQPDIYESIPPGKPKPENVILGLPLFHHSSQSRCIAVMTLSSHPQTESLLSMVQNPDLQRDARLKAEAWYQTVLAKYGHLSSAMFWESHDS